MTDFTVSNVQYRIEFDTAPFPCFMIHRFKGGAWEGGPSFGNYYGDAVNDFLTEVNSMGAKGWVQKNICPWFKTAFANAYGTPVIPPAPVDTPVTTANMVAVFGAVLAAASVNVGADGSVDLVV